MGQLILSQDVRHITKVTIQKTNKSPNVDCKQNLTQEAWDTFQKSTHVSDFEILYGHRFDDIRKWRRECRRAKEVCTHIFNVERASALFVLPAL
jgi:hypothetical protein